VNISLVQLLAAMGRINPAAWDAIIPHGPVQRIASASSLADEVALNPQPLPPREELQFAAARVANEIASAAISAEAAGMGEEAHRIVDAAIDDWCGTGTGHHHFPWPHPWPVPWHLQDPDPHQSAIATARLVGALTLASTASRMDGGHAKDALAHGAEQLAEAALSREPAMAR
jgi:hypothetical protein